MKAKKARAKEGKESSSVFFQNLRPKFLDWEPPTEEEKAFEVKARKEAREAELKRVTDLAKKRDAEKRSQTGANARRMTAFGRKRTFQNVGKT